MALPRRQTAIGALIFVALGYSLLGIAARLLCDSFEPMTQVYVRITIAFIISVILMRSKIDIEKLRTITRREIFWFLLMGIVGYSAAVYFITQASLNTKLVNVAVIYATLPFVSFIYSILTLGEKVRGKIVLLIVLSLVGVSMISMKSPIPVFEKLGTGEVYALLAAACAGWWSVSRKKLTRFSITEISIVVMFIAALSGFILAQLKGEPFPQINVLSKESLWVGLAIGAGLNITSTFLENFAFGELDVVFGNQILLFENIFSLLLGYMFYAEIIGFYEFAGGILILISVYFANKIFAKINS